MTDYSFNPAPVRRVAIIGGNRIPFARSNTVYAHDSNQDLLVAALREKHIARLVIENRAGLAARNLLLTDGTSVTVEQTVIAGRGLSLLAGSGDLALRGRIGLSNPAQA